MLGSRVVRSFSSAQMPSWASCNPWTMSGAAPHVVKDLLRGKWVESCATKIVPDPLNSEPFLVVPNTPKGHARIVAFADSLNECPKTGLHNPYKNVGRYLELGAVSAKCAAAMAEPEVEDFFVKLVQRVAPKSDGQARGEVRVSAAFIRNFGGDQVRFLARSFAVPGDHDGQRSAGHRWPFGPVALVTPFNFPLEIPFLQTMGALYMGNKLVLKADQRNSVVMEQTLRLLIHSGLDATSVDFLGCDGEATSELLELAQPRVTQFTGSSAIAEKLAKQLSGRVRLEDAGFDWKILGPDVGDVEYVAHTCDQDAYAYSGQKCSAQSIVFAHENWEAEGVDIWTRLAANAAARDLSDLTVGPVLSVDDAAFVAHRDKLLAIPGATLAFGGKLLRDTQPERWNGVPSEYGAWEPTAVHVPLERLVDPDHFALCTTELFGPFQVLTTFSDATLPLVLEALEGMTAHLTAAVVSNDARFTNHVLAHSVNGTTYCGRRARTTGAPQNHWFGPAGDPRGAGIGTPEAIKMVWSCHREIVHDELVPTDWTQPRPT